MWCSRRKRLIVGREKLRLQGIFPDEARASDFSQLLESDLAGNAFNAAEFAAVSLSLLQVLSTAKGFQVFLQAPAAGGSSSSSGGGTLGLPEWMRDQVAQHRRFHPGHSAQDSFEDSFRDLI